MGTCYRKSGSNWQSGGYICDDEATAQQLQADLETEIVEGCGSTYSTRMYQDQNTGRWEVDYWCESEEG